MEKLTIQEEEVMLHIWSMGECFVKDIVAKFPEPLRQRAKNLRSRLERHYQLDRERRR